MNVWIRQRSAPFSASAARSMSPVAVRASAAITGPCTPSAISRTASNSPCEEMGKPASRMSTCSRASCSAISTFSALVNAIPGACSPSRRVVSKIRTRFLSRTTPGSLISARHLLLGLQPGHHLAQLPSHLLELGRLRVLPKSEELRETGLGLGDPLLREGTVLDLRQDLLHLLARVRVDHPRAALVVAPLRRVRDAVAHPGQAALVDQVDDQLELVHTFEVRDLGLIAGRHQRLEPVADQLGDPTAQHRLLTEQVGLGLLFEGRLDDAGPRAADPVAVRQR